MKELIYNPTVVKRPPPANLAAADISLFQNNFTWQIKESWMQHLDNVRITSQGIILKNMKVYMPSVAGPEEFALHKQKFILSVYLKKKRVNHKKNELYIVAFDRFAGAYFHFITDFLSRLIECHKYFESACFVFPSSFKNGIYGDIIRSFSLKKILYLSENEYIKAGRCIFAEQPTTTGNFHPENLNKLRLHLLKHFNGEKRDSPRRIFISREKAGWRHLINEQEVQDLVKKYDFKIVHLEDHSFAEQVCLCRNAEIMISSHGAGLTNCMFMHPGSAVLELRKNNDSQNNCYYALACASGLQYFYQQCKYTDRRAGNYFDLEVDADLLENNIRRMIAAR